MQRARSAPLRCATAAASLALCQLIVTNHCCAPRAFRASHAGRLNAARPPHVPPPQLLQDVRAVRASCSLGPDGQLDLACMVTQLQDLGYACYLKHNNPGGCCSERCCCRGRRWRRCTGMHGCMPPASCAWCTCSVCTRYTQCPCPPAPALRAADPGHRHNVHSSCLEKLRHEYVMCAGRADGSLGHWCMVDPRFREQFAIAQPTAAYDRLLKVGFEGLGGLGVVGGR